MKRSPWLWVHPLTKERKTLLGRNNGVWEFFLRGEPRATGIQVKSHRCSQSERWEREKHTEEVAEEGCEIQRGLLCHVRLENLPTGASRAGRRQNEVSVIEGIVEAGNIEWIKACLASAQILHFICFVLVWILFFLSYLRFTLRLGKHHGVC